MDTVQQGFTGLGLPTVGATSWDLVADKPDSFQMETLDDVTGEASSLDTLETPGLTLGVVKWVIYGGRLTAWRLVSSTHATDAPAGYQRPLDYAGTTNERVWEQLL